MNNLKMMTKTRLIAASAIFLMTAMSFSACTKKSDSNDAAKFVGTWTGTNSCGGTSTVVFSAATNNTVTLSGDAGSGSCTKAITATLNVSGNNITLPLQTVTDGCGGSYTISGSGSISGSTLTFTESLGSTAASVTCTLTGTK